MPVWCRCVCRVGRSTTDDLPSSHLSLSLSPLHLSSLSHSSPLLHSFSSLTILSFKSGNFLLITLLRNCLYYPSHSPSFTSRSSSLPRITIVKMTSSLWPLYVTSSALPLIISNTSKQSCSCPGACRWYRCGQPGPQEHVYKVITRGTFLPSRSRQCEVFYATAGNYLHDPHSLVAIKQQIAHVLGYTSQPPHPL